MSTYLLVARNKKDNTFKIIGIKESWYNANAKEGDFSFKNTKTTDKEKCISCMRCVGICPVHARDFDAEFMNALAEKKAPELGGHKENYLFL